MARKPAPRPQVPASPAETGELRIEYLRLDELRRRPGNPKGHDVAGLNLAFERFGFVDLPILDERDGTLVAGHGRLDTLEERRAIGEAPPERIRVAPDGQWLVPVVRGIAFSDDGEALAYTVASNRLVERGGWDDELLRAAVAAIGETGERYAGTGYDEAEAEALLAIAGEDVGKGAAKGDDSDDDAAARDETALAGALNAPAFCRDGDLWTLGRHRLLVGDCTQVDVRGLLLGGGYADAAIVDSPFAIFGSSTGVASDVADDSVVLPAFESYLRASGEAVKVFGLLYVHCDWRSWAPFWAAGRRVGLTCKNMLVWDKKTAVLGQCYLLRHELVGVWARLPRQGAVGDAFHGKLLKGRQRRITRPNLLSYARESGAAREHNAQKPFEMSCDFVRDATDPGGVVLSPFCGSGTELVAAEHTGRVCVTLEILPRRADKAIMRWIRFAGGTATRASDGASFPAG